MSEEFLQNPLSLFDIRGKTAIVTGASGAFGALASKVLAGAGANVVLSAGNVAELKKVAAECEKLGGKTETVAMRPSSEANCDKIVDAAVKKFGSIDILVVASGQNKVSKIVDQKAEDFLDVMDANVTQSWLMARAAGRQMLKQGHGGKVILMSSARGLLGHPAGYTAYCASKSAVDGITKALGCEWGDTGITVNALGLTVFRSPLTQWMFEDTERSRDVRKGFLTRVPKGRLGEASDLAGPLLFLASKASDFYTGHILYADGGYTAGGAMPRIAVIGAGLMGHGIAQVFALAGHDVAIYDSFTANLDSAKARILGNLRDLGDDQSAVERVRPTADLAAAVRDADYVVEAVLEDLALKQKLFGEIERHVRPQTILASNTSVIPITKIMEGLRDRSRALGTHWWNPPYLVPLVEVIGTQWTSQQAIDWTIALHKAAGKMPVHVKKDVPGFVGNRLQHALWREAIALVENGICDAETVDTVVKASFGRRLAVLGPLENADLVGTDLTLAIHKTVLPDIDQRPGPSPYLEALAASGKLGFKSGEGFRSWSADEQAALRSKVLQHLKRARE